MPLQLDELKEIRNLFKLNENIYIAPFSLLPPDIRAK